MNALEFSTFCREDPSFLSSLPESLRAFAFQLAQQTEPAAEGHAPGGYHSLAKGSRRAAAHARTSAGAGPFPSNAPAAPAAQIRKKIGDVPCGSA